MDAAGGRGQNNLIGPGGAFHGHLSTAPHHQPSIYHHILKTHLSTGSFGEDQIPHHHKLRVISVLSDQCGSFHLPSLAPGGQALRRQTSSHLNKSPSCDRLMFRLFPLRKPIQTEQPLENQSRFFMGQCFLRTQITSIALHHAHGHHPRHILAIPTVPGHIHIVLHPGFFCGPKGPHHYGRSLCSGDRAILSATFQQGEHRFFRLPRLCRLRLWLTMDWKRPWQDTKNQCASP